ncbi:hypothetical protein OG339_40945 [Streptosporangium sp. NBC_01495]|uniref:hypothetical protein n=1 Tax=Streptosporangium sp. NBC_01495 TaxID=2903899 RepID=UPI002E2EAB82|nr:hypothetical protein [Streptosporangium sp. NBC_01495]
MSRRNPRGDRHGRFGGRPPSRAGLLVRLWRWRTEVILLATASLLTVTVVLSLGEGDWWPFLVAVCAVGVPAASGFGRSWVIAHVWCLVSRHRIQRACAETGIHTRSGRLPLILWITPSAAGEKALVLARAGTCAEDFDAFSAEIAAACYARDAVVSRHGRWANLLTVEIVRGDEVPGPPVGLDRLYARADWVNLRAEQEPDVRLATIPPPGPDEFPGPRQRAA